MSRPAALAYFLAKRAQGNRRDSHRESPDLRQLARKTWWKKPYYIKISLASGKTFQTGLFKGNSELSWNETYTFETPSSSSVGFQLLEHGVLFFKKKEKGQVKMTMQALAEGSSTVTLELCTAADVSVAPRLATTVSFTLSALSGDANVDHMHKDEALLRAREGLKEMGVASSAVEKVNTISGAGTEAFNTAKSFMDVWSSVLDKLELFMRVAGQMSEAIIAQRRSDDAVFHLMETIDDVHSFLSEAERTETVKKHPKVLEDLSALTLECAYFIRDYTANTKFRKPSTSSTLSPSDKRPAGTRIVKLALTGISKIQDYDKAFKDFKNWFNGEEIVQIDIMLLRCVETVQSVHGKVVNLSINDLPYAKGGAFDPWKACMPGTRELVLSELHRWINEPDSDDGARLLVLTGVPGFGKSAIANRLAQHYDKMKRLGSFVSFSRADQARRHPGNLISTIARDIADFDPQWKAALCDVVESNRSLSQSTSPVRQMDNFILGPAKSLTVTGPVVIIVDALDESGDIRSPDRESLLQVLSQSASALPRNFRFLVTARPEDDIVATFSDSLLNIKQTRLDTMDLDTIDLDIAAFIEHRLTTVICHALDQRWFRERWLSMLVTGSGHVFQWAATTCRGILEAGPKGAADRLVELTAEISEAGSLDDLYRLILRRKFPEQDVPAMRRFRRVMSCILVAKEPLSKSSLVDLCYRGDDKEDFELVLTPLGSLLSGINDVGPIKAHHTSFFDFLVDKGRSKVYCIDPTQYYEHLTRSCIRILNSQLTFNICKLQTSHMANTEMVDLADRMAEYIGPVLTYASRFLGQHLEQTSYTQEISDSLRALVQEHLLHWLEVISLLKQMGTASKLFASIHAWAQVRAFSKENQPIAEHEIQGHDADLATFAKDAIRFVETFAAPIAQSVPHIYLSALPFAPTKSLVSQAYLPQYPSTARLKAGKSDRWPAMLKTFEGHTNTVWAVAYSPDGKRIASASEDKTIRVRDTETGEEVGLPFRGHTAAIRSIAYSPSGHRIVSGSKDGTMRMWDPDTGELVGSPFKHSDSGNYVAYSPDGNHIVLGSPNGTVSIWDVGTGKATEKAIEGMFVAYSPDGSHIVSGQGRTVIISDGVTGEAVGVPLEGHSDQVNCAMYSPDGTLVASCSSDHTIRLWDAETRQAVRVLEGHTGPVVSVAFSPDGAYLVSGSDDKTICVWDVKAGKLAGAPLEGHASWVLSVAYSPDGTHIVSGSADGTVRVWDSEAAGFEAAGAALQGSQNTFLSMAYSPDGASIVSGSYESKIQMWDGNTGQLRPIPISGHRKGVNAVAFSPDGAHMVSGSSDYTVQVWNIMSGEAVGAPSKGHAKEVLSVGYSPDGSQIASSSFDGTVRTWDANSGEALGEPFNHDGSKRVWCAAYSPDGMHVVSGGDDAILRIWNIKIGEQVRALSGHTNTVTCVAYSPDGTHIASGSGDNTLRLWDTESGEAIGSPLLGHDEMIESVAFSPDGKNIVSGSRDQTVRMWDAETREPVGLPIRVHGGTVAAVAYSPDGTRIASASRDGTIRIWDVAKMEARYVSIKHGEMDLILIGDIVPTLNALPSSDTIANWRTAGS
ncbi:hypothetical protein HWV62_21314 [Athelia sp. TMB]|nr:hypothetical protein HWV62_21314 [Athelia sp. TMB]